MLSLHADLSEISGLLPPSRILVGTVGSKYGIYFFRKSKLLNSQINCPEY